MLSAVQGLSHQAFRNCNMRKTLAVATVFGLGLGLLAGCSKQSTSASDATTAVAGNAQVQRIGVPRPTLGYVAHFASLPDRGELLAYDHVLGVKRGGAYTAYPVSISEEHALNAMSKGDLVLNAPDGQPIRLKYESHVEHPDGNWTWIGRNADGASAVLTFGENAVYGTIPQGTSDVLRVTMAGGHSYLVATDRSKLAGLGGMPHVKGGDFMTPPKRSGTGSLSGHGMFASVAHPSATLAAAPTVIDVLVGFTDGYAAGLGGASVAQTRIANLVDYTNVAYNNSGVTMRVRLVGYKQVSYPDNTDNGDTLQKMSGFDASGPITPDSRFNDLRAMRETVGADLVMLVRKFTTPENGGCGIAWLIGGNQAGITTADAPYGYSVVSDGQDRDTDGNNYYCIDATLAHELGHNMGQAHNKEDSKNDDNSQSYGLHAYSFGYREASSTGFHTVMAYPSSGDQVSVPYFANPNVKYIGRVTGIANESDNVRSMNIAMPVVSNFRATVVPVVGKARNDFNADGKSDILWRNFSTGANTIWKSADATTQQAVSSVATSWSVAGTGDFDADGRADILWRNTAGNNTIWKGGNSATQQAVTTVSSAWQVAGTGDFDGDGKADILWRSTSGGNVIWKSAKSTTQQAVSTLATTWRVAGVGDFDGDGKADILWRNTSGANAIWRSGNAATQITISSVGTAWNVAGIGDFDGDGRSDVFWRSTSGGNAIWKSGNSATQQSMLSLTTDWTAVSVGDFDNDGKSDIFWRKLSTGNNVIWKSANAATKTYPASLPTQWRVVG
jgi:hypothetical protein